MYQILPVSVPPISMELFPLISSHSWVNSLLYRNASTMLPTSSHLKLTGTQCLHSKWKDDPLHGSDMVQLEQVSASLMFSASLNLLIRLRSSCSAKSLKLIQLHLVNGQQKQRSTPVRAV